MSSSNTVRGSDANNFSVVPSAELPARVAQDCQLNKADAKDLSAQSSTLTDAEALELSSLEATVERSLKAFWEIGQALRQIRDRRLYRQDFSTFAVILPILAEHAAGDVAHACSDVHVWAFFADR